ncbi:MAG: TlpA family protein disulfide reductase [Asticcacaulis sp.]|nr:TlpA family protein disulfide reductase [Asticcacaulis sp.]
MDNPLDSDGLTGQPSGQPAPKPQPQPVEHTGGTAIAEDTPQPKAQGKGKKAKKRVNIALFVGIVIAVVAVAVGGGFFLGPKLMGAGKIESAVKAEAAEGPLKGYVKGSIAHLVTYAQPKSIDNLAFIDRDKKPVHLADFKGQVVVLNLWATWCAPCRFEMPTLAHLQQQYAGRPVKVLPLSGDPEEKLDDVKSFIDVQEPLQVYADPDLIAKTAKLNVAGLPSTLILDKQGRIVARLDGEASWDTPEVHALLDKLSAE